MQKLRAHRGHPVCRVKSGVKVEFILYVLRWQLSSFILTPVIRCGTKRRWPASVCAVVANLIGAVIFYPVDKFLIF